MQGVIKSFDPSSEIGIILTNDRTEYPFAPGALDGSIFQRLRQGQRVNFDLTDDERATNIRIGSETDMGISTARV